MQQVEWTLDASPASQAHFAMPLCQCLRSGCSAVGQLLEQQVSSQRQVERGDGTQLPPGPQFRAGSLAILLFVAVPALQATVKPQAVHATCMARHAAPATAPFGTLPAHPQGVFGSPLVHTGVRQFPATANPTCLAVTVAPSRLAAYRNRERNVLCPAHNGGLSGWPAQQPEARRRQADSAPCCQGLHALCCYPGGAPIWQVGRRMLSVLRCMLPPAAGRRRLQTVACSCAAAAPKMFQYDGPLDEVDPEVAAIIRNEKKRQVRLFKAYAAAQGLRMQPALAALLAVLAATSGLLHATRMPRKPPQALPARSLGAPAKSTHTSHAPPAPPRPPGVRPGADCQRELHLPRRHDRRRLLHDQQVQRGPARRPVLRRQRVY